MWREIQDAIWRCKKCRGNPKVECNLRQWTEAPEGSVKLLVVGIAPPYVKDVNGKKPAASATNDSEDNIRKFIEETLCLEWDDLKKRGLFFLHAVKCAIVPDKKGFQNPPNKVVDECVPSHFAREFEIVRAKRVVTLGGAPFRGVIRTLGGPFLPTGVRLSSKIKDIHGGHKAHFRDHGFIWHVTYFPRRNFRQLAAHELREAARKSGIIDTD